MKLMKADLTFCDFAKPGLYQGSGEPFHVSWELSLVGELLGEDVGKDVWKKHRHRQAIVWKHRQEECRWT